MSNFVNPQLVEGYVDDYTGQSVQGVYQGSLDAPQEEMLDRKLKAEREARKALAYEKTALLNKLNETIERIVRVKKRHNVKDDTIARYRHEAVEIKEKLEHLERIKI